MRGKQTHIAHHPIECQDQDSYGTFGGQAGRFGRLGPVHAGRGGRAFEAEAAFGMGSKRQADEEATGGLVRADQLRRGRLTRHGSRSRGARSE